MTYFLYVTDLSLTNLILAVSLGIPCMTHLFTALCKPQMSEYLIFAVTFITPGCKQELRHVASVNDMISLSHWQEYDALIARQEDVSQVRDGDLKAKRRPPRNRQTRSEAFIRYLSIFYDRPDVKVSLAMFSPNIPIFFHVFLYSMPYDFSFSFTLTVQCSTLFDIMHIVSVVPHTACTCPLVIGLLDD